MQHYDYIFTGSGLAAMMTVYEMVSSGKFENQSILLLDDNPKKTNDRTWCFWDEGKSFDSIVSKDWHTAVFADSYSRRVMQLMPHRYKMIKGLDFYNLVLETILKEKNIDFIQQQVIAFEQLENNCVVKTQTQHYTCNKIFNSIFNSEIAKSQTQFPLLQQHFIGWFIKSKTSAFNPEQPTFMDFSIEQKGNTRFMYVLPFSETEALVEYTLFSKELLDTSEYETAIQDYLHKLGIIEYDIVERECGNIPMTVYPFWKHNSQNIIHIGSAGGWTKASTGYTFKNSIKKSRALVEFMLTQSDFRKFHKKDKFWYYDLLFLDVLSRNNALGSTIFSGLFQKGNPQLIFKFLDEETTFTQDLQIIGRCPKRLFMQAVLKRIF